MKKTSWCILTLLACLLSVLLPSLSFGEARSPLTLPGKTSLPLRVLTRAFSTLYAQPTADGTIVEENVPAFQAFFVYQKKGGQSDLDTEIWYEVGSDDRGTINGWMSSKDVFEWKQTMCLSYTHPAGRYPVLMFDRKERLLDLAALTAEKRQQTVEQFYLDITTGALPKDFPIVTIEPKKAIDITKEFYLLPILDFAEIELDNREARLLQLAAVTGAGGDARESSDIRVNREYLQQATQEQDQVDPKALERLGVDVVWVMDTTNSMMPYIAQTLKVVEGASRTISANSKVAGSIHFGVWGYRDSLDIPGIGYNVKNYTPNLQTIQDFTATLKTVDVTASGSQGYDEDVFSGINGAIDQTAWTPNAMRLIILVGDAPAHGPGHKWNLSGQTQETLRAIADDRNVSIYALHLKDPEAEQFHETTAEQFQTLSTNKGAGGPTYYSVDSTNIAGFTEVTQEITENIIGFLAHIKKQANQSQPTVVVERTPQAKEKQPSGKRVNLDLLASDVPATGDNRQKSGQPSPGDLTNAALKAALVRWVGSQSGTRAPHDVVAWVVDKDLLHDDIQSLEVRLLLNKQQLDALRDALKTILEAGRQGQVSGDDFFTSLQAAAATTARNPELLNQAKTLAESGLIPEFLEGLPYTSRIMDMNNELWNSWSVDEQNMFLADLEARIMAYEIIHDGPEGWIQLNKEDDPGQFVYPLTLELLP